MRLVFLVFLTFVPALLPASGQTPLSNPLIPDDVRAQAERLRDQAMDQGSPAYAIVESLTTEVGPRLAGTESEARARAWAVAKLKALGFEDVRVEPFTLKTWVRGAETAEILAPYPQPLRVTALGRSGATGPEGLSGDLVYFETFEDLERAEAGSLKGKIAFIDHAMTKTQDGASYSYFGRARFSGPRVAAQKGAAAVLIRSIGTHSHRFPHTGGTNFGETDPIPAGAVSPPDADQILRILDRGKTVTVRLTLTPKVLGVRESGNVIADIPGREAADEIILTGGHLDSWDLGTGAVDDGAGIAITTAAMKLILDSGLTPRRTLRLIHWGSEEVGLIGARAYADAHAGELDRHIAGSESDFGAERIYKLSTGELSEEGAALMREMAHILAPLGIGLDEGGATSGGPDLSPLNSRGLPATRLAQDGRDYFDLHHTPDDTLDKVDPDALDQNVAAYAVYLWVLANSDIDLRPAKKDPQS